MSTEIDKDFLAEIEQRIEGPILLWHQPRYSPSRRSMRDESCRALPPGHEYKSGTMADQSRRMRLVMKMTCRFETCCVERAGSRRYSGCGRNAGNCCWKFKPRLAGGKHARVPHVHGDVDRSIRIRASSGFFLRNAERSRRIPLVRLCAHHRPKVHGASP